MLLSQRLVQTGLNNNIFGLRNNSRLTSSGSATSSLFPAQTDPGGTVALVGFGKMRKHCALFERIMTAAARADCFVLAGPTCFRLFSLAAFYWLPRCTHLYVFGSFLICFSAPFSFSSSSILFSSGLAFSWFSFFSPGFPCLTSTHAQCCSENPTCQTSSNRTFHFDGTKFMC